MKRSFAVGREIREISRRNVDNGGKGEGFLHEERGKRRERKKRVSLSKSLGPSRDFHSGSRGVGKNDFGSAANKVAPLLVSLCSLGTR